MLRLSRPWAALAAGLALAATSGASEFHASYDPQVPATWPVIALIIDDIGHRATEGRRAVELPGAVAVAVLPHTPHAIELARRAHDTGKEVMLHLPLEAVESNDLLGPGAILLDDSRDRFRATLEDNLASVPHVVGVNNHMGSLLTRHPGHMGWLMTDLRQRDDLFFIDSVTTTHSVAYQVARENGVPTSRRDVFLDDDPAIEQIAAQFEQLKARARRTGYAVGIGHPLPTTMDFLERALPTLSGLGYRLLPVREVIELQSRRAVQPRVVRAGGRDNATATSHSVVEPDRGAASVR